MNQVIMKDELYDKEAIEFRERVNLGNINRGLLYQSKKPFRCYLCGAPKEKLTPYYEIKVCAGCFFWMVDFACLLTEVQDENIEQTNPARDTITDLKKTATERPLKITKSTRKIYKTPYKQEG